MASTLRCEDIRARFAAALRPCEKTDMGLRVLTHCLYPSFEPVAVYVARIGETITVHDGGGAARSAWMHGRDPRVINHAINRQATIHHLDVNEERLTLSIESEEWLPSAIMAVANASAAAAQAAGEGIQQATEKALHDAIRAVLRGMVSEKNIASEYALRGKSGKMHRFDFAVVGHAGLVALIDTVAPHHISVAAKYVAFSDTSGVDGAGGRFIVHDKPLPDEDVALLGQFADVLPSTALKPTFEKHFARREMH
jgi:hypothetical protein